MRNLARLGSVFIVISISLGLSLFIRGGAPISTSATAYIKARGYLILGKDLWSPRSLRFEVIVAHGARVDIYIIDEGGIELWEAEKKIFPLYSIKNVASGIYSYAIPRRGIYAFLIHNPNDFMCKVTLSITFYGFENDLIYATAALGIIGSICLALSFTTSRYKKRAARLKPPLTS